MLWEQLSSYTELSVLHPTKPGYAFLSSIPFPKRTDFGPVLLFL